MPNAVVPKVEIAIAIARCVCAAVIRNNVQAGIARSALLIHEDAMNAD